MVTYFCCFSYWIFCCNYLVFVYKIGFMSVIPEVLNRVVATLSEVVATFAEIRFGTRIENPFFSIGFGSPGQARG